MAPLHLRESGSRALVLISVGLICATAGASLAQPTVPEWADGTLEDRGFVVVPGDGRSFEESYDVTTLKPKNEHLELYEAMRKEVADLGLALS